MGWGFLRQHVHKAVDLPPGRRPRCVTRPSVLEKWANGPGWVAQVVRVSSMYASIAGSSPNQST